MFIAGDFAAEETSIPIIAAAVENSGGLDLAMNNAGVMDAVHTFEPLNYPAQKELIFARLRENSDADWDGVIDTNIYDTLRSLRAELRQLIARGCNGAILNIASIAGLIGIAGNSAYVATKHVVNGMTRNAAVDYAPYGIRVTR